MQHIARHAAFWGMYYLYAALSILPDVKLQTFTGAALYASAWDKALPYAGVYGFAVYFSVYFILPRFLAKRRFGFLFFASAFLMAVVAAAAYFISKRLCEINNWECSKWDIIGITMQKCIGELFIVAGAALILKTMKDYALRQRESERLAVENARNSLRLLKMQMHPRILFGCLHMIYMDIEAGTSRAPEMILKLSDLLSYLLYDAESEQVPLHKEVSMIRTYGELKKLEYKDSLDFHFEVIGDTSRQSIAPGLLLPLLEIGLAPYETAVKSFVVAMELQVMASTLYLNLKNNNPGIQIGNLSATQAILENIRKRLELVYPRNYKLEAYSEADFFIIGLQLALENTGSRLHQTNQNDQRLSYGHS